MFKHKKADRRNASKTIYKPMQTEEKGFEQKVLEMLMEIKFQNSEIEQNVREVQQEIQALKKQQKTQPLKRKQIKNLPTWTMRRKRFATNRQLSSVSNIYERPAIEESGKKVQFDEEVEQEYRYENESQHLQLAEGGESTFIRKLDQTTSDVGLINQDMRVSIGANLLQMMQMNNQTNGNSQQSKGKEGRGKKIRNFNFRFNLDEIDKIIEEDDQQQPSDHHQQLQVVQEQDQQDEEQSMMIDESVVVEEQQVEMKKSIKRETSIQRREKMGGANIASKRKMWGVNPRKSIKGLRGSSKERPKTAGVRLGRAPITKKDEEDPIFALLMKEQEKEIETPQSAEKQTPSKEYKIVQLDQSIENKENIEREEEKVIEPQVIKVQPKRQVKRGMFNAPPPNLIESLLLEDSQQQENNQVAQQKQEASPVLKQAPPKHHSPSPSGANGNGFRQNRFVKVNNFLVDREKSQSKSRSRIRLPDIDGDEEENEQNENPFDSISTLIKVKSEEKVEEAEVGQRLNLFFHGKQNPIKKGTANFGK